MEMIVNKPQTYLWHRNALMKCIDTVNKFMPIYSSPRFSTEHMSSSMFQSQVSLMKVICEIIGLMLGNVPATLSLFGTRKMQDEL